MVAITLQNITKDNWQQAIKLKVAESQKNFVAPNWYSIIEVLFNSDDFESRGIYADDVMVGYVMYGLDDEKSEPEYWIVRLMIGEDHQKKGYGRQALPLILAEMQARYQCDAVFLSFEPENTVARDFYLSEGFVDTGRVEYGETVFRYDLKS